MNQPRALVTNAADVDQVKRAGRKEKDREALFLDALRASLSHAEVRYVFAEYLQRAGLDVTSFDHNGSMMNFKEGRRNFGLEIKADLYRADERLADLMETERRARVRADNRAIDAAHTARAEEAITNG